MLDIYQHPTDSNPTLGLTFKIFSEEKFGIHNEKYNSVEAALYDLNILKMDTILMNLETFWTFCDKVILNRTQAETECITAIRNVVNQGLDHKDKVDIFLANVVENTNFIRALVKAVPREKKVATVMMAATIVGFCKKEIDERQKNKDKEE